MPNTFKIEFSGSAEDMDRISVLAAGTGITCERCAQCVNSGGDMMELAITSAAHVALIVGLFRAFIRERKRKFSYFEDGEGHIEIHMDNPTDKDIENIIALGKAIHVAVVEEPAANDEPAKEMGYHTIMKPEEPPK